MSLQLALHCKPASVFVEPIASQVLWWFPPRQFTCPHVVYLPQFLMNQRVARMGSQYRLARSDPFGMLSFSVMCPCLEMRRRGFFHFCLKVSAGKGHIPPLSDLPRIPLIKPPPLIALLTTSPSPLCNARRRNANPGKNFFIKIRSWIPLSLLGGVPPHLPPKNICNLLEGACDLLYETEEQGF